MPDKITYYAVIGGDRRSIIHTGWYGGCKHDRVSVDETLRKDFSWTFTPAIVEWRAGGLDHELVEVSHQQAEKIIEYFRGRWGPGEPAGA